MWAFIPGAVVGVLILLKTKNNSSPTRLITISSFLGFVMSIVWIGFASNFVIDILELFGLITSLPVPLLALTIIAWGNCLGDMSADVAMTRRGFGEMAITGCIAGPIFNVAVGAGISNTLGVIKFKAPVEFGFYHNNEFNMVAILPFCLMIG